MFFTKPKSKTHPKQSTLYPSEQVSAPTNLLLNWRALLSLLLASVVFSIGCLLWFELPQKAVMGEHGQKAIQMLDAMRRPLLAIKDAELKFDSGGKQTATHELSETINDANLLVDEYLSLASYNEILLQRVEIFKESYIEWIEIVKRWHLVDSNHLLPRSTSEKNSHQLITSAHFLKVMNHLGEGEVPIHQDVDGGRYAVRFMALLLSLTVFAQIIAFIAHIVTQNAKLKIARNKLEGEIHQKEDAQAKINLLISNTPGVIYSCKYDDRGSFTPTFCTPNILNMMGYSPVDFYNIENFWASNIHPEDSQAVFENYDQLFKYSKLLHRYRWRHKDGHYVWIRDELTLFRNSSGDPESIVGVWVNIDEQKAIELELEKHRVELEGIIQTRTEQLLRTQDLLVQKERLAVLGELATTVSHELRNPLGTIGNSISMIAAAINQQHFSSIGKSLELAGRNVERCDRIINELLEFANGKEPEIETVKFDSWLGDILKELNWPSAIHYDLQLSADVDIAIDLSLMYRAISNIVNNAIQALETKESADRIIEITTSIDNEFLNITINDNGPGISIEDQKNIFKPLFSTKNFGIGLGLPIVKNSIENLGGAVNVESEEGDGTSVRITIPT